MAAKKADDASDEFGKGADSEEARPEDADAFGSGESVAGASSLTSDEVATDAADEEADEEEVPRPGDTDDRAVTGREDDDEAQDSSPLRDLADGPGDTEAGDDVSDLDA